MKIDSIKIKTLDTRFTSKPTRITEIKTRSGTIETPTRAATMFEYNAKASVPTNILIGNPITFKYSSVGHTLLKNLLSDNKPFSVMYNAQQNANDRTQHSLLNFTLFQPTMTATEDDAGGKIPSAMEDLRNNHSELDKFLDLIIALQESLNFDIITIPYLDLPFSTLESEYKKRTKYIRSIGKEPFFVVHLKHNPQDFEKIMKLLTDELQVQLIGLNFQKFQYAALNYRELSKYYAKDVLFFTIQTTRIDSQFNEFSTPHYMPFLSNDIFSIASPPTFDPEKTNKKLEIDSIGGDKIKPKKLEVTYEEKLLKLRIFNKKELNLQQIISPMKNYSDLLNDVENPTDNRLINMLNNFMDKGFSKEEENERFSNLKSFTVIHELKTSVSEFAKFREYIKQSDTTSYVSEHPLLNKALTTMK
ncbi:MAG: hypothetical protein HW410_1050 [Nitrosarchaeum sp.]|nr:hypothetical protein [Nitrosarchaeum sp.]